MKRNQHTNRRTVLKILGAGVAGSAVLSGSAAARGSDYGNGNAVGAFLNEEAILKDRPIWESGVADKTGQDTVEVQVGVMTSLDIPQSLMPDGVDAPDEGPFKFEPRAVEVSPETTVVWKWTENPFPPLMPNNPWPHDVHSLDESDGHALFHSDHQGIGTFRYTFDDTGPHLYYCTPHGNPEKNYFGMRGAVIVSDE